MELVLDVEMFVKEIQKRPALWYSSCDEYKDRQLRKDHWKEICEIIVPDFNEKSETEQTQIGRTLQIKWKNLRDAYVRSLRGRRFMKRSEDGTTTVVKHAKPYIYAKLMAFLKKDVEVHNPSTRHNNSPDYPCIKKESAQDEFEELHQTDEETSNGLTINISCKKWTDQQVEDPLVDAEDSQSHPLVDAGDSQSQHSNLEFIETREIDRKSRENDDEAFFRSLHPMLQTLSNHQKISFRIDVMKLLLTFMKPDKTMDSFVY